MWSGVWGQSPQRGPEAIAFSQSELPRKPPIDTHGRYTYNTCTHKKGEEKKGGGGKGEKKLERRKKSEKRHPCTCMSYWITFVRILCPDHLIPIILTPHLIRLTKKCRHSTAYCYANSPKIKIVVSPNDITLPSKNGYHWRFVQFFILGLLHNNSHFVYIFRLIKWGVKMFEIKWSLKF